jgi:hypothetical protein
LTFLHPIIIWRRIVVYWEHWWHCPAQIFQDNIDVNNCLCIATWEVVHGCKCSADLATVRHLGGGQVKWQWALASLVCHVSISWWCWIRHVWPVHMSLFNLLSSYMQQRECWQFPLKWT